MLCVQSARLGSTKSKGHDSQRCGAAGMAAKREGASRWGWRAKKKLDGSSTQRARRRRMRIRAGPSAPAEAGTRRSALLQTWQSLAKGAPSEATWELSARASAIGGFRINSCRCGWTASGKMTATFRFGWARARVCSCLPCPWRREERPSRPEGAPRRRRDESEGRRRDDGHGLRGRGQRRVYGCVASVAAVVSQCDCEGDCA